MQLDAAHRYPRNVAKAMREAIDLATFSQEIAGSCMYTLPARSDDTGPITGPSVRLAEIIASCWRNLHIGARALPPGPREIVGQAVVWDLERNLRVTIEAPRSIVTGKGYRYGDNMIQVTGAAAISIALRNAIFRVVPRTFIEAVYSQVVEVATGESEAVAAAEAKRSDVVYANPKKRDELLARFTKSIGVPTERVLEYFALSAPDEMLHEQLKELVGIGTAIMEKRATVEEFFPAPKTAKAQPAKSRGAALDALAAHHQKTKTDCEAEPVEAEAEGDEEPRDLEPGELQDLLAQVDERWQHGDCLDAIAQWTPLMRAKAAEWAQAQSFAAETGTGGDAVPAQPAWTVFADDAEAEAEEPKQ